MPFNRPKTYMWVRDRISNFTDEQITKQLQKYGKTANRRMDTLEKHFDDAYSPALHAQYKQAGGDDIRIKTDGDINQKRKELRRALDFLEDSTSTVTGAKKYKKDTQETLGLNNKRGISQTMLSNIWYLINMAKENVPIIANYKELGEEVYDIVKDYDFKFSEVEDDDEFQENLNEMALKLTDVLQSGYEDMARAFNNAIKDGVTLR